jgi:hypothetical protein
MTFDEAVRLLRESGLLVEVAHGHGLTAATDQEKPLEEIRAQGVSTVYGFGLSIREKNGQWLVRTGPSAPTEQYPILETAVRRALALFHEYRATHSPRQYGDQFALLDAGDPCTVVEDALVSAGWLASPENLTRLEASFVNGCAFRVEFAQQKRIVLVSVAHREDGLWRVTIGCYKVALATGQVSPIRLPMRGHSFDGNPIPDRLAASLSYDVACVLHSALVKFTTNLRWALHREPEPGNQHSKPVAPAPT